MELFIGNLDPETTEGQLRTLFKGFDKQAVFRIIMLETSEDEEIFIYGLVIIESDRLAKKAIKKLNYKKLNDKPVLIREFQYRASQNDKRALNWRMKQWQAQERRSRERRKNRKVMKNLDDYEITGIADYAKKYD